MNTYNDIGNFYTYSSSTTSGQNYTITYDNSYEYNGSYGTIHIISSPSVNEGEFYILPYVFEYKEVKKEEPKKFNGQWLRKIRFEEEY